MTMHILTKKTFAFWALVLGPFILSRAFAAQTQAAYDDVAHRLLAKGLAEQGAFKALEKITAVGPRLTGSPQAAAAVTSCVVPSAYFAAAVKLAVACSLSEAGPPRMRPASAEATLAILTALVADRVTPLSVYVAVTFTVWSLVTSDVVSWPPAAMSA
jgi:hypothetical protein